MLLIETTGRVASGNVVQKEVAVQFQSSCVSSRPHSLSTHQHHHEQPRQQAFAEPTQVIILMGAPASGKGTQSVRLAATLGFAHISTGDILREEAGRDTARAQELRMIMNRGDLVPDQFMIELVRQRVDQEDCRKGFILDGFPRTCRQAELLQHLLISRACAEPRVISLEVSSAVLLERMQRRRATGVARSDDNPETFANRLAVYESKTLPLKEFYAAQGQLRCLDGAKTVAEVELDILAAACV